MGKYLIPAFPSHKSKDAARKYAFSMIDEDIERRRVRDLTGDEIKPVERISTLETALAAVVKSQNLEMSQFYPLYLNTFNRNEDRLTWSDTQGIYSEITLTLIVASTELPLGGRVVGD